MLVHELLEDVVGSLELVADLDLLDVAALEAVWRQLRPTNCMTPRFPSSYITRWAFDSRTISMTFSISSERSHRDILAGKR